MGCRKPAKMLASLIVTCLVFLPACDSPTDSSDCDDIPSYLTKTMYWGYVTADHWEPNRGVEIGNIYQPMWFAPDTILVNTTRLDHGTGVRGLFQVAIDPQSFEFRALRTFAFPYVIRDYDYDPTGRLFALTFSRDPNNIQTVYARVDGNTLAVEDTLLGASWYPLGARFVSDSQAVVVYAHNPSSSINGFYLVSQSGVADSLVHAVNLTVGEARGFDVGGSVLVFGVDDSANGTTSIQVIDLTGPTEAREVRVFPGKFESASLNMAGSCAIVSIEDWSEPGSVVRVLDIATKNVRRVDVRTRRCTFPIADFATWNPSATAFAFSASGFNGEGALYPRQLWVCKGVVCP